MMVLVDCLVDKSGLDVTIEVGQKCNALSRSFRLLSKELLKNTKLVKFNQKVQML